MGKINVSGLLEYILWNGSVIKIIQLCCGRKRDVEHRGFENARGVGKVLSPPSPLSLSVFTHTQNSAIRQKNKCHMISLIFGI